MRRKKQQRGGFTLVEMLIAMSIFVIFVGVLIGSYSSIVRSQQEANDYRVMYSEARRVFDTITMELREGIVDYGNTNYRCGFNEFSGGVGELMLVAKDGVKTLFYYDDNEQVVRLSKGHNPGEDAILEDAVALHSAELKVTEFKMYVYPVVDPYDPQYVFNDALQFQPMVTVFAKFEKEKGDGIPYTVDFQTTISSRIYNQIYPTTECSL